MKRKGFTLIELLITLAVLVGLSLLGISSSSTMIRKNEQQTLIDEIRSCVRYARIQALNTGKTVYLLPLDDSFDWSKGIALKKFNNKKNELELMYQWEWYHPNWTLTWSGVNSLDRIILSNNPAKAISNGQFRLTNVHTKEEVKIILNRLGRVKLVT